MQTMTGRGRIFLASWEGCVLRPYNDSGNNATIGVGHLIHYGPVTSNDIRAWSWLNTTSEAYQLLARDLVGYERQVSSIIHQPMSNFWFNAFVDLVYNCGAGPLFGEVGTAFNQRRWGDSANAMLAWCHVNGQFSQGLYRRRLAERAIVLQHFYHNN